MIAFLSSSCVGTKKFKSLEEEKLKLENTLLGTKQELSEAKRALNKLEDAAASSNQTQSGAIRRLEQALKENKSALDAAQSATVTCQGQLQTIEQELTDKELFIKKELAVYETIQKDLSLQYKSLRNIKADINLLIIANPTMNLTQELYKDELTLSFDHQQLFSSSTRSLSTSGRALLYELAEILKKYPSIYIDIQGHTPASLDVKDNWKNSTRKTLSVLYTLTQKGIIQNKIRVIGYGQFNPITTENDPLASQKNSRTEIVLHYQNMELLKRIPTN